MPTLAEIKDAYRALALTHDAGNPCASARIRQLVVGLARAHGMPPKKKGGLMLKGIRTVIFNLGPGNADLLALSDRVRSRRLKRAHELTLVLHAGTIWQTSRIIKRVCWSKKE